MNNKFLRTRSSFFLKPKSSHKQAPPSEAEVDLVNHTLSNLELDTYQIGYDLERWSLHFRALIGEMSFDRVKANVMNATSPSLSHATDFTGDYTGMRSSATEGSCSESEVSNEFDFHYSKPTESQIRYLPDLASPQPQIRKDESSYSLTNHSIFIAESVLSESSSRYV